MLSPHINPQNSTEDFKYQRKPDVDYGAWAKATNLQQQENLLIEPTKRQKRQEEDMPIIKGKHIGLTRPPNQ